MTEEEETTLECPECGDTFTGRATGKGSVKVKLGMHRSKAHGIIGKNRAAGYTSATGKEKEPGEDLFEAPSEPARKGMFSRWRKAPSTGAPDKVRPHRPRQERHQPGKRRSLAKGGAWIWSAASVIPASQGNWPAARVMEMQADATGLRLDQCIAGSKIDRMVQPWLGDVDRWGELGKMVVLPALITMHAHAPTPMSMRMLREVVASNMQSMADALVVAQEEAAELAAACSKLETVGLLTPGDPDPVGTFISMLLAPPEQAPPQPAEVVQEA